MRVLFTNNALVWGGAEKNTLQIMAGLRERGRPPARRGSLQS